MEYFDFSQLVDVVLATTFACFLDNVHVPLKCYITSFVNFPIRQTSKINCTRIKTDYIQSAKYRINDYGLCYQTNISC